MWGEGSWGQRGPDPVGAPGTHEGELKSRGISGPAARPRDVRTRGLHVNHVTRQKTMCKLKRQVPGSHMDIHPVLKVRSGDQSAT